MPPIRVLVVDDSAFARKVLREVLTRAGMEVVGIARDGLEALEKITELKPDVVTLDLVMPNLDGLGVLHALPAIGGPRVVVVSMAGDDSALGIAALQAGAVELVQKPTALAVERLYELSADLINAVTIAAGARQVERGPMTGPVGVRFPRAAKRSILVIGASTGGPQALTRILRGLPAGLPVPVALVLHLPVGYTQPFAERLDRECDIDVVESSPGLLMTPGRVVVGRAGVHLKFKRTHLGVEAVHDLSPADTPHRPAVDVLFESAAAAYGSGVLGVVLTGMGDDGLRGSRAIKDRGGELITESEASCVVYGMPRCVDEAGLSSASVAVDGMVAEILIRL